MLSSFSVCIMSSVTDAPIPGCPAPPNGLPRMPLPPPSMHRRRRRRLPAALPGRCAGRGVG